MTAADTERKLAELSFLREIAQLTSSARDWDEMLRIVIDRTTTAMGAEVSSLYLVERREGLLRLVASNGLNPRAIGKATLRIGEGISGWVANARVPLTVRDVHAEPRWKFVPSVDVDRFTSMLSVPLISRDEIIGVMNVQTIELRDFERGEIDFLQTIANQVAGIIEKSRLQRDAEHKLREVSALFEVSNVLTSTLELDEVLGLVVDRLVRVYPDSSGAILLRDDSGEAALRAKTGDLPRSALSAARTALAEKRLVVGGGGIALPLIAGDRLVGAVALHVPGQAEFAEAEIAFVGALANQAALAIDKASLYALERKTAESLRELDRARSDFVAVVTHDLRTPLSMVRGYLDLFAEHATNGDRQSLRDAAVQVERLDQLVDRILASVKAERPNLNVRRARFDLRAGLVGATREFAPMARRHRLSAPRAAAPLWARGDKRRTAEVVAGLVHNATKYAPAGTRIAVSITRERERAVVRVTDEGPGVAPEDRARIFEPFVRLGSDEISGAGIGLFSCRRVVEAQGGALWYEDVPGGRGSVFAFSVPLARGEPDR
ncbi:MAG TPA: GAF domain-containing protein [Candidatus Limnocylindria bacterium]|nr:GAF domain-containing protein [Candidatus Limnocylindria bacterium]